MKQNSPAGMQYWNNMGSLLTFSCRFPRDFSQFINISTLPKRLSFHSTCIYLTNDLETNTINLTINHKHEPSHTIAHRLLESQLYSKALGEGHIPSTNVIIYTPYYYHHLLTKIQPKSKEMSKLPGVKIMGI